MSTHTQALKADLETLVEDARALIAATADVASEKVVEARKRLGTSLDSGRTIFERVRHTAVESAKATREILLEHRYQAIAIALGVGVAVTGLLIARQYARKDK